MAENDRFLSFLGLACRAGRLSLGFESTAVSIRKKESRLILTAQDISAKTLKELNFALRDSTVRPIATSYTMEDFANAVGRNVRIISINDSGFAKNAKRLLNETGEETV